MKTNETIGFIGAGNISQAFLAALLRKKIFSPQEIIMSDIDKDRLTLLERKYSVNIAENNIELFNLADIILFAVKPQEIDKVLSEIRNKINLKEISKKIIITVLAGTRIAKFEKYLFAGLDKISIARVMPNVCTFVFKSASGFACDTKIDDADKEKIRQILNAIGISFEFDEKDLDAITAISGSGPAYVFYFIEAMNEASKHFNLNDEAIKSFIMQTVEGSLDLLFASKDSPENLRKKVTSKGGTTEAAIAHFEKMELKKIIKDGIKLAQKRSIFLSTKN